MLERIESRTIIMNGLKGTKSNINGEVVKVVIDVGIDISSLNIEFFTDIGEFMFGAIGVKKGKNVFYPINEIEKDFKDYFYVSGPVMMKIEGLPEGQAINNIIIFFKS